MKLGEILKQYRDTHNVSMSEFAIRIGMSKAYISMLEKNYNPSTQKPIVPSGQTLKKCAKAMGISLDELIRSLDDDQLIALVETTEKEDIASIEAANRLQVIIDMLSDKGKQKFFEYLFDLQNNPDNVDPNKFVKDIFINYLNDDIKRNTSNIAKELRILNKLETQHLQKSKQK